MLSQLHTKLIILFSYLRHKYFRRFQSRASLLRWQHKKVIKFISKLPVDNYYRRRLSLNVLFTDWQSWPLIDKNEMMDNFDCLNTVGIKKEEAINVAIAAEQDRTFLPQVNGMTVGLSSGTSGYRGLFVVSKQERYDWVGCLLAKILKKSILKHQKIALFLRANSMLYESLNNSRIEFCFFDMIKPVSNHKNTLNAFNPDILIAPPSVLRQLADLKKSAQLTISPEQIYSAAEVFDPIDKRYIQEIFKKTIGQIYQATEGFLGISCAHGKLHLNEDLLVIEKHYLDKNKKKFNPIITDFSRTSQPILRYVLKGVTPI